jgi:putative transposase
MKKSNITLSSEHQTELTEMLNKGMVKGRILKRIIGLLELNKGKTYGSVSSISHLSSVSLQALVKKYKEQKLECLYDAPRPGRPIEISEEQKDKVTTLALEQSHEGHSQWSLRLLADKVIELGYCEHISHTQVNKILKKIK